jgi:hypothetical protein
MSNYVIFSAYYKHGETETIFCNSLFDFLNKYYDNITNCLSEIENSYLDEEEEEDSFEDENCTSLRDFNITGPIGTLIMCFDKYKQLLSTPKEKCFDLMTSIEKDENKLLHDIVKMNDVLRENDWSIRSIISIQGCFKATLSD